LLRGKACAESGEEDGNRKSLCHKSHQASAYATARLRRDVALEARLRRAKADGGRSIIGVQTAVRCATS
jgi:hypothetical protein